MPATKLAIDPDERHPYYVEAAEIWRDVDVLLAGTKAIRQRTDLLPKYDAENDNAYRQRVLRSFLDPSYEDAVAGAADAPFTSTVKVNGTVKPPLDRLESSVDRQGKSLTDFTVELFYSGVNYGVAHVLIDHPPKGEGETAASDDARDLRPYFRMVTAPQVIYWRWSADELPRRLVELRVQSENVDGSRITDTIERWLVVQPPSNPGDGPAPASVAVVQTFARSKTRGEMFGDWAQTGERATTFPGIPLVTLYFRRWRDLTGRPVFERTANLNLEHWQAASRYRTCIEQIQIGILFGAGFSETDLARGLTIGPGQLNGHSDPSAKLSYVQDSGAGAEHGRLNLQRLAQRMERTALEPLMATGGDPTATGRKIDARDRGASLKKLIRATENGLAKAYETAALWRANDAGGGTLLSTDFGVDIADDVSAGDQRTEEVAALSEMEARGALSRRTFLTEVHRRGLFAESFDVEAELETIRDEQGAMPEMPDAAADAADEDVEDIDT